MTHQVNVQQVKIEGNYLPMVLATVFRAVAHYHGYLVERGDAPEEEMKQQAWETISFLTQKCATAEYLMTILPEAEEGKHWENIRHIADRIFEETKASLAMMTEEMSKN
jgi:hypothetical protein